LERGRKSRRGGEGGGRFRGFVLNGALVARRRRPRGLLSFFFLLSLFPLSNLSAQNQDNDLNKTTTKKLQAPPPRPSPASRPSPAPPAPPCAAQSAPAWDRTRETTKLLRKKRPQRKASAIARPLLPRRSAAAAARPLSRRSAAAARTKTSSPCPQPRSPLLLLRLLPRLLPVPRRPRSPRRPRPPRRSSASAAAAEPKR